MPTTPTQTERSAALARLRAYLAMEPGSAPPSHDDLRVLLHPSAQAVAIAADNERLRTALADATAGLDSAWRDLMAIGAENERLRAELAELRAQLAPPTAPMPVYLQPESPEMACPSCGGRVHWGSIGDDGLGYAYCARSDHACKRTDQPEIGDGACAWRGRVRLLEERRVVVVAGEGGE